MKYVCLGSMEEKKWETMSETERNTMVDECFAYDDVLRKKGNFVGGEALQGAGNATTLRWKNGKVSITDGPYAETKEFLAGFAIIDVPNLDVALEWAVRHPAAGYSSVEVRPLLGSYFAVGGNKPS